MIYTFEYKDTKYSTQDIVDLEQFVFQWIDDNWNDFIEYGNNKHGYLIEDNYEAVVESFFEDTVKEEENDIR